MSETLLLTGTTPHLGRIQRLRELLGEASVRIAERREGQKARMALLARLKERMKALEQNYSRLRTQLEYQPQLDLIQQDVARVKGRIEELETEFV